MRPDQSNPTAPIERVEPRLRRTGILAGASMAVAAALLVSGFGRRTPTVLRAERVELLSAKGVPQAILGTDSVGFVLTLLDARGRPSALLRLSDEPRVAVETGHGKEVAGLGAPRPHLLEE